MIDKLKVTPLVSPEEAVKLAEERTIEDIYIAMDIAEIFDKITKRTDEPKWRYMCKLATIWNAGRIQGIREERAKKRYKRTTAC